MSEDSCRVMITGASGFIGGYLCQWFSQQGYSVIATSRRWTPTLTETLSACQSVTWDVLDIASPPLPSADILIHTATANDILSKDPAQGLMLSGIGTQQVLKAAIEAAIPRVIVFSTFQVYGTELTGIIDEQTPPAPLNDYGLNHLVAEGYAAMASRQGKLATASVRPANVYGRFVAPTVDRWSLVPACFCQEAFKTGQITLKSSGLQMRNFVSLDNIARGCEAIMNHFPSGYEVFNLGSSQNATVLSVAQTVARIYEARYHRPLQLNIESDLPQISNLFTVSLDKLKAIGFQEASGHTLETEIQTVFDWLERSPTTKKQ